MPAYPNHQDIRPAYVQPNDPGAVKAGVFWVDTSFPQPFPIKVRNLTNTGWDIIGSATPFGGPTPGRQGEDGEEGDPGIPGLTGKQGPVGPIGPPGFDGEEGDPGDVGPPGAAGVAGSAGAAGAAGQPGPPGLEGEEGETGDVGPPGSNGAAGATGATGAAGLPGPPGLDGEEGEEGPAGPPGTQGIQGNQGTTGQQGPPGFEGEEGEEGDIGPPGLAGVAGAAGATGATGPAGPPIPGEDGEEAESVFAGPPNQPGGLDTYVQYNKGGFTFGGDPNFIWDAVNKRLRVGPATLSTLGPFEVTLDASGVVNGPVFSLHSGDTVGPIVSIQKSRGTGAAPTVIVSGDIAGSIVWNIYNGSFYTTSAQMQVRTQGTAGECDIEFFIQAQHRLGMRNAGSVLQTPGFVDLDPAATDGFMYIARCAGKPTGVPTSFAGCAPIVVDTSGKKLWLYSGGWFSASGQPGPPGFGEEGEEGPPGVPGPAGSGGGGSGPDPLTQSYTPGSFTIPTGEYAVMSRHLILTSTQRATIRGTGALRIT